MKLINKYRRAKLDVDVVEMYRHGSLKLKEQHDEEEKGKVGKLSVGNSGILVEENGQIAVAGNCQRIAYARMHGVDIKGAVDESKGLMFLGGHLNEVGWVHTLGAAIAEEGISILQEKDIPTAWETSNGVIVTGRPDIVLATQEGLIRGLENKKVCSMWTARDVIAGYPNLSHVIQAAHYSVSLGRLPYTLVYTNDVNYYVGPMMAKHFPAKGTAKAHYCSYNEQGKIVNIEPFNKTFDLSWRGDTLLIKEDMLPAPEETIVTASSIENFFEFVAHMNSTDNLGPAPTNVNHHGDSKQYSSCKYCKVKDICSSFKGGAKEWLQVVRTSLERVDEN